MNFLQAIWKVILYIIYTCRVDIGLFSTGTPSGSETPIVVPNPSTVSKYASDDVYSYVHSKPGGANLVAFYYGFSSYMPTVMPITDPLRAIAAMIAKWLYWLDIAFQVMYVGMFNIMNIGGNTTYFKGNNYQVASQGMTLTDWFHDGQMLGTVICIIMFMSYIIATMIAPSSKTWPRLKTMCYCLFLGTGVVCAMPVLISFATYGASSVAQGALTHNGEGLIPTSETKNNANNNNDMQMSSLANQFFFDNVYSVPHKIFDKGVQKDQPMYDESSYTSNSNTSNIKGVEDQPNSDLYSATDGHNATMGTESQSINIPLKIINLKEMSPSERESWNGLTATSITPFLNEYGGEDDVLDKTTLAQLAHEHNNMQEKKDMDKRLGKLAKKDSNAWYNTHEYKNGKYVRIGKGDATSKHNTTNRDDDSTTGGHSGPHMFAVKFGRNARRAWHNTMSDDFSNKPAKEGTPEPYVGGKTVAVRHQGNQTFKVQNTKSPQNKLITLKQNNKTIKSRVVPKSKVTIPKAQNQGGMTTQNVVNKENAADKNNAKTYHKEEYHPKKRHQTKKQKATNRKKANKYGQKQADSSKNIKNAKSQAHTDEKNSQNSFETLFEYHLSGIGPNASIEQLRDWKTGGSVTAPINHSYAKYKVSWANIYLGLIVLLIVFIAFIFKLLDAFFEAAVMYAVMDIMVARDMNDPRKMKQWFRNFFNLWAMITIDVVIIRIFFIGYFTIQNAVEHIFSTYLPVQIGGNLTVMGIVESIMDIGLLVKCLEGNQAINEALGRPTGARNGWAHALAFMGGVRALGMGTRALGHGIGHIGLAGKGATNMLTKGGRHMKNGRIGHGLKNVAHKMGIKGGKPVHRNGTTKKPEGALQHINSDEPTKKSLNPNPSGHTTDMGQTGSNTQSISNDESQPTSQPSNSDQTDEDGQTLIGGNNNDNDNVGDNHAGLTNTNTNANTKSKAKNNKPSKQGEHFTNSQIAHNMAKAKNMAHKQAKLQAPKDIGKAVTPQTAGERKQAQARALRSKKRPVQAHADKFFNGVTHVGNGIAELGGGQGLNVDHDTDAATHDPGYGDNPNELQDEGTSEDSDEDINDLFNDNSSLSDLSQKLDHTQQQVNSQTTTSHSSTSQPTSQSIKPLDEPFKSVLNFGRHKSSSSDNRK